ncbi:MAG: class flavin-dependent oxidoreductase [Solirubrobacterales bacterium]|nr:class flavin-dependent oxidoreductase [Solirubrobacterales bacterium]
MTDSLTVRVGVGWNPFDGEGLAGPRLWPAIELLEELGADSLWLADTASLGGLAPLPALAAIAARTEKLKLGTGVLVLPPRNPVLLAREMATVDVLSGGRLLPAGGLGIDLPTELEAMGVARDERTSRLEESVRIIKALWPGEPVTLHGRHWSLTDVRLTPRPVRRKLELWLGGRAPAALRRIGRIADGWLASFVGPDEFGPMVDVIRAAAAEAGRSIDEDHYGTTLFAAPTEADLPAGAAARLARRPELAREDHIAFGTGELRALLERFLAAGASKFVVVPVAPDPLAWLRELHAEVIAPIEAAGVAIPRAA